MSGPPHMGRVSTEESCMYCETLFLEQPPTLRAGQMQPGSSHGSQGAGHTSSGHQGLD